MKMKTWRRRITMKPANRLWTKTAFAKMPPIKGAEAWGEQAVAYVKLFSTSSDWAWYVTEFDPETGHAFGLVSGFAMELGYFDVLGEMQDMNNRWRELGYQCPPFERDLHYHPTTLAKIRDAFHAREK